MSNIKILDCTLRDGGYINNWHFGKDTINAVFENLTAAGINVIEAGFLTDIAHSEDDSLFANGEELIDLVKRKGNSKLAVMIALGEKETDPSNVENSNITGIDIIRITFHNSEKEIEKAISFAKVLMNKGYNVCMQPVGTTTYSDKELLALIDKINELKPYAFYLVDTLGTLYKNKLLHFVDLIDNNLEDDICIGFHSHNNLQMSFSNSQLLIEYPSNREFIIDSSLYGMGRGAGNLCTELVTRFLNELKKGEYNLVPILEAIDNYIYPISLKHPWGYNAHYYMSAIYNCHPNYSSYLMNMQTLTMKDVNLLLQNIPKEERHLFNKKLIEKLYFNFQNSYTEKEEFIEKMFDQNREVLVLAPGYSLTSNKEKIQKLIIEKKPIIISINIVPDGYDVDFVFISNRKRLYAFDYEKIKAKIIVTSNLPKLTSDFICVKYDNLCDEEFEQPDNAGMMLLRLLNFNGVKKVYLAGFDGFSSPDKENYYSNKIANNNTVEIAGKKNLDIAKQIAKISKCLNLEFVTESAYQGYKYD